jgi:hypothetical protein
MLVLHPIGGCPLTPQHLLKLKEYPGLSLATTSRPPPLGTTAPTPNPPPPQRLTSLVSSRLPLLVRRITHPILVLEPLELEHVIAQAADVCHATSGMLCVVTIPDAHGARRGRAGLAGLVTRLCWVAPHRSTRPSSLP